VIASHKEVQVLEEFPASGWSIVSEIYHENHDLPETPGPALTERLEYLRPNGATWTSDNMALFGCRTWNSSRPTRSPHGNNRAVVSVTSVLNSPDDYLLPLKQLTAPHGRLERSVSRPDNFYFEFLYVRKSDIMVPEEQVDLDWMARWKIREHRYLRLTGEELEYATSVDNRKVWYKILVPYVVQFDEETEWEVPLDIGGWDDGVRRITEQRTAEVAMRLQETELTQMMGALGI
jgi:hypothetical protein